MNSFSRDEATPFKKGGLSVSRVGQSTRRSVHWPQVTSNFYDQGMQLIRNRSEEYKRIRICIQQEKKASAFI